MGSDRDEPGDNGTLRVLIVEDNDADYLLLRRRLQKLLEPSACERSATRAELTAALAGKWDLIATDLHLFDIEGQALLNLIAAVQPSTPCLVLSGSQQALQNINPVGGIFRILEKGDYAGLREALTGSWKS
jgi:CheY-like chemotaxis protein